MKTDNYPLRVVIVSLLTVLMVSPVGAQSPVSGPGGGFIPPSREFSYEKTDEASAPRREPLTGIGTIAGVVRSSAGIPLGSVMVTATRTDGKGIRSTVTGRDGIYSFADLPAGMYSMTADSGVRVDPKAAIVEVTGGHATRFDLGAPPDFGAVPQVIAPPATISSITPAATAPAAASSLATVASVPVVRPSPAPVPAATSPSAVVTGSAIAAADAGPAPATSSAAGSGNTFWNRWLNGKTSSIHSIDNQLRAQAGARASLQGSASAPNGSAPVASLGAPPIALDRPAPTPDAPQAAAAPAAPAAPAKPAPVLPDPLSAPDPPPPGVDNVTPFAYADFSWMNGQTRNNPVLDTKFYTPELRWDSYYMLDTNQPIDHTMGGSTEQFRSGEFQIEQASVGGDFHWDNVRGRLLTMSGLFATTTPRNDASDGVGQWDLRDAYKYFSEAWGGYHWDGRQGHGFNIDVGIFVSYIGLFSYYNFDNWAYQPSYVSSNTPWFFNGLRIQYFVTNKLKIEPWIVNGWQSYAKYNGHKGLGGQILWLPTGKIKVVANTYGNGTDDLGVAGRSRIHVDDSVLYKYYEKTGAKGLSKAAFSFTGDIGCEYGAGVSCMHNTTYNPVTLKGGPNQDFVGTMAYARFWFDKDLYAFTLGSGVMSNPGRYLTLLPPINGATAQTGTPYFEELPGDKAFMYDANINFQWMPKQNITWWLEAGYRHSNVPYWSGRGGITPPAGDTLNPGDWVCANGNDAGISTAPSQGGLAMAEAACGGGKSSVWFPDLREGQVTFSGGVLVKF